MPKNVGRYEQGGILTQPNAPLVDSGMPHRATPAGPVPQSPQWEPDSLHAAPNNDGQKPSGPSSSDGPSLHGTI